MQSWISWEEPDRDIAIAHWKERDIHVVFPLRWARWRSMEQVIDRSLARIKNIEREVGTPLAPGSVLRAFSHQLREEITADTLAQTIDPEVYYGLNPRLKA